MRQRPRPAFPSRDRSTLLLLAFVLVSLGGLLAAPSAVAQGTRDVRWERFDVALDLRGDGSLHVTETQTVAFRGRFQSGFASIPLDNVEQVGNITVTTEDDGERTEQQYVPPGQYVEEAGTFTVRQEGATLDIDYSFEPTLGSERRVFILEYDVLGAVRVYPEAQPPSNVLVWNAISREVTDIAPVDESTVTLTLPEAVDPAQVDVEPQDATSDGQTWTWRATDLDEGESLEVGLQFPAITSATAPSWQAAFDEEEQSAAEREERSAIAGVMFLGAGLLGVAGGGVALFALWYTRGRDPHVGAVAEFLPEPPDNLGPGAAGTLLDERAQPADLIATVLDLGRRGVLRVTEEAGTATFAFGESHDIRFTLLDADAPLRPYEQLLLQSLLGPDAKAGAEGTLSAVQEVFRTEDHALHAGYYDELVHHGYFSSSPLATRTRWQRLARVGVIAVAVLGCVAIASFSNLSGWVWFPVAAAVVLMLAAGRLAPHLPRKTRAGAEATAKWRAFRTYLDDIDKYEQIAESKEIFERYLPFAVAFGLERSWVDKFARVQTPAPEWFGGGGVGPEGWGRSYGPTGRRRGPGGGWVTVWGPTGGGYGDGSFGGGSFGRGGGSGGGADGGDFGLPDLQGGSDRAGRTLQGSSDSFFDMLNTAAKVFGGMSGGSSGGSRGWGGGSSFGGGGGFGGGSGGGGRGFR